MSKRRAYNRKNEPKERDLDLREKRGHAINNDEITKACEARLAESGIGNALGRANARRPCEYVTRVTITRGRARSLTAPVVSMNQMILPQRIAHLAKRRDRGL